MTTPRPTVTTEMLRSLAEHARLPMPDDRVETATGTLQAVQGAIDGLDAVDLEDTPPATTFDARWS
ncbi:hypothetical protein [Leekyejoonella antrihumi]|uniref:DUF4089 domain-containing protein n=1 Tax=Leekyejoonella antrihumi TaxID=1660198 RepID=A0A563E7N3_9MICO|nr:hypothetical protein [Leekyejoonella antrihumi]TWP38530.1 hypothetical protein FGL98_01675 [Leekyejoonella antrihumi]